MPAPSGASPRPPARGPRSGGGSDGEAGRREAEPNPEDPVPPAGMRSTLPGMGPVTARRTPPDREGPTRNGPIHYIKIIGDRKSTPM
ncbi:hypothetical protein GCM10027160_08200 [Streptomyces calidiresistens]